MCKILADGDEILQMGGCHLMRCYSYDEGSPGYRYLYLKILVVLMTGSRQVNRLYLLVYTCCNLVAWPTILERK